MGRRNIDAPATTRPTTRDGPARPGERGARGFCYVSSASATAENSEPHESPASVPVRRTDEVESVVEFGRRPLSFKCPARTRGAPEGRCAWLEGWDVDVPAAERGAWRCGRPPRPSGWRR